MKKNYSPKKIAIAVLFSFNSSFIFAQGPPPVLWSHCYGGSNMDYFNCISQIRDGGFCTAGEAMSNDGNLSGNILFGGYDSWLVVLNSDGTVRHQKTHGCNGADQTPFMYQAL